MIHRHRGNRRKQNVRKALRKERIARELYGPHRYGAEDWPYYASLHAYSKNKIHCSCPLCSAKMSTKQGKSRGPVSLVARGIGRLARTNGRYGKKNYTVSELREIDSMRDQLREL